MNTLFSIKNFFSKVKTEPNVAVIQTAGNSQTLPLIKGYSSYSIVTAAYNVERYIDDYFNSLVNQTLSFEKNIDIVIVDDGSVDGTARKVAKWIEKYPANIRYIYQSNAGQGAARNNGLTHARNEWVTFIDMDDFVSHNYFEACDEQIRINANHQPLKALCANFVFYFDDKEQFSDTHPLRFRFAKGNIVIPIATPGKHICLNVNAVLFKRSRLLDKNLRFNHDIKPGFEDSDFINSYLLDVDDGYMAYLQTAKYYYRKRDDGTSTLDTGWKHPGRYDHQLRLGSLGLIKKCIDRHGHVKEYIQRVVLYDLIWHLSRILRKDADIYSLDETSLKIYQDLIEEIFTHISVSTIMSFELGGTWFFQKRGMLALFKNYSPDFNIAYIDDVDTIKDLVKIRYFSEKNDTDEEFKWDGDFSIPVYAKTRTHTFFGKPFINERIVWLRIGDTNQLTMRTCNRETRITLRNKQYRNGVTSREIHKAFNTTVIDEAQLDNETVMLRQLAQQPEARRKFGNCWLFMDRDTQADDNAEHLYRYAKRINKPYIYFILGKYSKDWDRLEKEGFNLLEFGSSEHKIAMLNAEQFISSHCDQYIFADLEKKLFGDLIKYKFTFLQHGVISHDLSHWLNSKHIDCFVTTTVSESLSISEDGPYKFSGKEVVLTGLPRHDHLNDLQLPNQKTILIMPTWRNSLMGKLTGVANQREYNEEFKHSNFAHSWSGVLNSELLRKAALELGYKIALYPHANLVEYIAELNLPPHITVITPSKESIQTVFANATLMLTDYSSVGFDFAYMKRSILYFQFDSNEVINGGHTYRPGYFDYVQDGFGPVCESLDGLLVELDYYISRDCKPKDVYLQRIQRTFNYSKISNCQRTLVAIEELTTSNISQKHLVSALVDCASNSTRTRNWKLSIKAWSKLTHYGADPDTAAYNLARAYRELEDLDSAYEWISKLSNPITSPEFQTEKLAIALSRNDTDTLAGHDLLNFNQLNTELLSDNHAALIMQYCRIKGSSEQLRETLELFSNRSSFHCLMQRAEIATQLCDWHGALHLWELVSQKDKTIKVLVRMAEAHHHIGAPDEAWKVISKNQNSDIPEHLCLISGLIAYAAEHWKSAENLITRAHNLAPLTADEWLKLARSQRKGGKLSSAEDSLINAESAADQRTLLQEHALLLSKTKQWAKAIAAWENFLARRDLRPNRDGWIQLAKARLALGQLAESNNDITRFENFSGPTSHSRKLRIEIESIMNT
ncbi:MAG: CDP-glycerol glycerophosphotransferase family protein [Pseudomonadota bacterium]